MASATKDSAVSGSNLAEQTPDQIEAAAAAPAASASTMTDAESAEGSVSLINRNDHPITLAYGNDFIIIPPRASVPNVNRRKIGATKDLPQGLRVNTNTGRK